MSALLPLYARERAANRAAALAVVVTTAGSTYSEPGTPLLIAKGGEYAGLLSGGCLEGDLLERVGSVLDTGTACVVSYDTRGRVDELFGLGAGCEGAMDIFVLQIGPGNDWQPLQTFEEALSTNGRWSGDYDKAGAETGVIAGHQR
jgi:xanthine dehydrogenase accessory factor